MDSDLESSQEKKRWSDTQASRTPTRHAQARSTDPKDKVPDSTNRKRSDSMSTISADGNGENGAYKVVIKRPNEDAQVPDESLMPTLEVPIPHYRLGTPRFSQRGTAFLHSTVYSRTSSSADVESSGHSNQEYDSLFPTPPGMEVHAAISRMQSQSNPQPSPNKGVPMRMPITTIAPVFHKAREPIGPGIYDAISANLDDASIVRYGRTWKDISAASPARLIAQITSPAFLDYDLISDFFLTVRAYLSINDLLEYLLSRFEWAINQLSDYGRVVRVRSFAAIRHWILNYFPYDFVVDRDLRVKFCDHLNSLTRQCRLAGHDASDLKLILDLKKCWNGRCAVYWDTMIDESDERIDEDIVPGGVVGSRDSQLTHPNDLLAQLAKNHQLDQEKSVAALHNWMDSVIEAEVEDKAKQASSLSSNHPHSLLSEQSTVQATSCSVPGKTFKPLVNQSSRNVGPHPVPSAAPAAPARRVCHTPMAQSKEKMSRSKPDHNRSGSFSDALRDKRTSLGAIQEGKTSDFVEMSVPFAGSLVRGSAFPPGSPFIDNLTPQGSGSSLKQADQYPGLPSKSYSARPTSPGLRHVLGNIRRAWSSKQGSTSTTPTTMSSPPFLDAGLPMHIAFKIEGYGDQHHQLEALKKNARIDLLCADVTEMFERAMGQETGRLSAKTSKESLDEEQEPLSRSWQNLPVPQREALQRNHSGVTTGSRSIVIVDDTSFEPPVPEIPATFSRPSGRDDSTGLAEVPVTLANGTGKGAAAFPPLNTSPFTQANTSPRIDGQTSHSDLLPGFIRPDATQQNHNGPTSPQQINSASQQRPSFNTGKSHRSTRSRSDSLRKFASYQSGLRTSGPDPGQDRTFDDDAGESSRDQPGRMLRRRPGGDLRANQNVHDMQPIPRPASTGSITTYTDSMHDSATFLRRVAPNATNIPSFSQSTIRSRGSTPVPRKSLSLVHSHSSRKDLRRSFELAVAQFAQIPDDSAGGYEATLLKLEGKFRKSPIGSSDGTTTTDFSKPHTTPSTTPNSRDHANEGTAKLHSPPGRSPPPANGQSNTIHHNGPDQTAPHLYPTSEASYNSTPLVERGALRPAAQDSEPTALDQTTMTMPKPLFSPSDPYRPEGSINSGRTSDLDSSTRVRRGRYRSSVPTMTTDSFLLDEDEFLSDLDSDLSDGELETESLLDDAYGSAAARSMQAPSIARSVPSNAAYAPGYLPSPPMTKENAMALSSEALRMQNQRKPPTPEPSPPVHKVGDFTKGRTPSQVDGSVLKPFANKMHRFPTRRHMPFVLAFDAEILAQQFTLIERDALSEINWQDLIDLRWQQTCPPALNWVEYLRYSEPNGIDLVTARFNVVVKWAISEVVLTHNAEERAMTLMKYIRIAQYCRKYRNYATLLQLTLALTSIDCTRLTKTWSLVPEAERAAMKEMESLVSPLRNFHNLRAEMEASNLEDGCIPVVGKCDLVMLCRGD